MLNRKIAFAVLIFFVQAAAAFSQASALRDYVGIIDGTYHPDVLAYFEKLKDSYKKRGKTNIVKEIDDYIKMGFGTGFVYVAPDGTNYIITNYHVVAQTNTISISFENIDGAKTTYSRLKVIAADENIDIAILTFDNNIKPFKQGLSFVTTPAEEGSDVFSAGFPGFGTAQIWQFSKGIISNARMRFPRDPVEDADVNEMRFGPFIQHTSPIDPGNSGGPLLVQKAGVTSGYAVAGINSMIARRRASTYFAIPSDRALAFITEAVKPKSDTVSRQILDERLDAFIKSLDKPKAVYGAIADYISNSCTASNAEYAILETFSRAPRTVQDAISNVSDPVDTIKYCVAWLIEDSFRGKTTGALRATLGDITKNTDGSYTVQLKFSGDRVITTTWVSEFGIWKLDKAGDLVSGDKTLVKEKEKQKEVNKKKAAYDDYIMVSLGYTDIFDHWSGQVAQVYNNPSSYSFTTEPVLKIAPALDISLLIARGRYFLSRTSFVLAENFWQLDSSFGFSIPINVKIITLSPYAVFGFDLQMFTGVDKEDVMAFPKFGVLVQGGLMLSSTYVPGLYIIAGYQYNIPLFAFIDNRTPFDMHMLKINVGYAFAF